MSYRNANVISALGLVAIASSVATLGEHRFPSLWAVLPVAGTVAIIKFAVPGTVAHHILQLRPLVGLGLISYSAYLWHQPILVFARIKSHGAVDDTILLSLALLSLLPAYLSWRFVETPFRRRHGVGPVQYNATLMRYSFTIFAFALIGLFQLLNPRAQNVVFHALFSSEQKTVIELLKEHQDYNIYDHMFSDGKCVFWQKRMDENFREKLRTCEKKFGYGGTVVLGDSHALNVFNALAKVEFTPFLVGLSQGGCRPHDEVAACHYDDFAELIAQEAGLVKFVLFHQSGGHLIAAPDGRLDSDAAFQDKGAFSVRMDRIEKISDYLLKLQEKTRVAWLGPFVEARVKFGLGMRKADLHFNANSIYAFRKLDVIIAGHIRSQHIGLRYIAINPELKPLLPSLLHGRCLIVRDGDHFSRCGEHLVGSLLKRGLANKITLANQ